MQEEIYRHKLDLYYLATLGYVVTFVAYVAIRGSLVGDTFEVVWRDPIVYLLAGCSVFAIVALSITAILNRTVIIRENEIVFRTRFKERTFHASEIESIAFRRESPTTTRGARAYPSARIRLRSGRRRPLRLRPGSFERSAQLMRSLRDWAERNGIELRARRRR